MKLSFLTQLKNAFFFKEHRILYDIITLIALIISEETHSCFVFNVYHFILQRNLLKVK